MVAIDISTLQYDRSTKGVSWFSGLTLKHNKNKTLHGDKRWLPALLAMTSACVVLPPTTFLMSLDEGLMRMAELGK